MGRAPEHSPEAWEAVRDIFTKLYQSTRYSLKEIMIIMKEKHGFDANERQWKGKVDKWSLSKNIKSKEATFMLYKKAIREQRDGKATIFKLNGRQIEDRKLVQAEKKLKSTSEIQGLSPYLRSIPLELTVTPRNITYHTPVDDDRNKPSTTKAKLVAPGCSQSISAEAISKKSPSRAIECWLCQWTTYVPLSDISSTFAWHFSHAHLADPDEFVILSGVCCNFSWLLPITEVVETFEEHLKLVHNVSDTLLHFCDGLLHSEAKNRGVYGRMGPYCPVIELATMSLADLKVDLNWHPDSQQQTDVQRLEPIEGLEASSSSDITIEGPSVETAAEEQPLITSVDVPDLLNSHAQELSDDFSNEELFALSTIVVADMSTLGPAVPLTESSEALLGISQDCSSFLVDSGLTSSSFVRQFINTSEEDPTWQVFDCNSDILQPPQPEPELFGPWELPR